MHCGNHSAVVYLLYTTVLHVNDYSALDQSQGALGRVIPQTVLPHYCMLVSPMRKHFCLHENSGGLACDRFYLTPTVNLDFDGMIAIMNTEYLQMIRACHFLIAS